MDDSLLQVSQRLDALAADDDLSYLHFSFVHTPPVVTARESTGLPLSQRARPPPPGAHPARRRPQRRRDFWTRCFGLSWFYVRFVLVLGVGWFLLTFSLFTSTLAISTAPDKIFDETIQDQDERWQAQVAREMAAIALGAALGAALCGSLADYYGRRRVVFLSLFWWIAFQIASAFAWDCMVLLVFRGLQGLGVGGQLLLFLILLFEIAAHRQRGRVVIMGVTYCSLGIIAGVYATGPLVEALGWKTYHSGLLGGATGVYWLWLLLWLRDSPRFLAATGRVDAALHMVEQIEHAHGLNRHARVTMPSSLFEPPTQRRHTQSSAVGLSTTSQRGTRYYPRGSLADLSPRASLPPSYRPRRTSTGALAPGMVSIWTSFGKRWRRVLCCRPYASRAYALSAFSFVVALQLSMTLGSLSRFTAAATKPKMFVLIIGIASFVGCVFSATMIDRTGRIPMLSVTMLVCSLATTLVAMQLHLNIGGDTFLALSTGLLSVAMSVTLTTAAVWTLEHFGVLIRATGVGFTLLWCCVGIALGQWLVWSSWITHSIVAFVLWGVAAVFLLLALLAWICGTETWQRIDIDIVEDVPTRRGDGHESEHKGSTATGKSGGGGMNHHAMDSDDDCHIVTPEIEECTHSVPASEATTYVGSSIYSQASTSTRGRRTSAVRFSHVAHQRSSGPTSSWTAVSGAYTGTSMSSFGPRSISRSRSQRRSSSSMHPSPYQPGPAAQSSFQYNWHHPQYESSSSSSTSDGFESPYDNQAYHPHYHHLEHAHVASGQRQSRRRRDSSGATGSTASSGSSSTPGHRMRLQSGGYEGSSIPLGSLSARRTRLDSAYVRERHSRNSSRDVESNASDDVDPERDILEIDIDPFEGFDPLRSPPGDVALLE
ncbi:hypothetical protein Poli38472_007202 [Pythium oligandrum]|uniref:Major facilitator superfamily (MFS) profile domain-containing protein n=1 Tax=Pythium oligandrum TaxID=41045 RepID=A0A8K1FGU0_PYTOL|nr:hypothetical protein Poli38472_007202 [Pythium oligandrum]|eukprot:TMW59057.1 hypothetical protein Poli38472_007202 [Pythium oligandrum]